MDQLIKEKMDQGGYKMTRQRQVILEVLQASRGEHLTAEEVLSAARQKAPNLGIATVYRTLEKMASLDILYKTRFDEGKHRYELADESSHHHHHVQCLSCGRIFELEENLLNDIERQIEQQGFSVVNHRLTIYAVCPKCNQS